jgi:hypothetical protein
MSSHNKIAYRSNAHPNSGSPTWVPYKSHPSDLELRQGLVSFPPSVPLPAVSACVQVTKLQHKQTNVLLWWTQNATVQLLVIQYHKQQNKFATYIHYILYTSNKNIRITCFSPVQLILKHPQIYLLICNYLRDISALKAGNDYGKYTSELLL